MQELLMYTNYLRSKRTEFEYNSFKDSFERDA